MLEDKGNPSLSKASFIPVDCTSEEAARCVEEEEEEEEEEKEEEGRGAGFSGVTSIFRLLLGSGAGWVGEAAAGVA